MNRQKVKAIIGRFGSQRAVAEALNIQQTAVSRWVKRGKIPIERWDELLAAAAGLGIPLTFNDLLDASPVRARPDEASDKEAA